MKTTYSIKELELLTGIKAHTIRVWEQRYNIIEPVRTDTNIRCYCDSDLKKMLNIAVLVQKGLRISKVVEMSDEQVKEKVIELSTYKGDYEAQVNGLKVAMVEFNSELFDRVFSNSYMQLGIEQTFSKVVAPFITQVGYLWQAGAITIAHEHFMSNLIRQKLFSAIDQMIVASNKQSKTFVFYLPNNEMHELGLLYLSYLVQSLGHKSIYLGQSVPVEHLSDVCHKMEVDYFLSIFTTHPHEESVEDYLKQVSEKFKELDCRFLLSGHQLKGINPAIGGERFTFFDNIGQLKVAIQENKLAKIPHS